MPTIDLGSVIGPKGPQGVTGNTGATGPTGSTGPNQLTGSTSTTLSGVLQGNGSVVQAVASDATPTSGSNNIVRSGVVFNSLQRKVNPNLLRNAYFIGGGTGRGVFPINTIGKTVYDEAGWAIDHWYVRGSLGITLQSTGLHAVVASTDAFFGLNQPILNSADLIGKTVTISVLISDYSFTEHSSYPKVGLYAANSGAANSQSILTKQITENGITTITGTIPNSITDYSQLNFSAFYISTSATSPTGSCKIIAAKLEIGETQTLAHLENGVWVLNEIPDYPVEESRCLFFSDSSLHANESFSPATAEMIGPVEWGNTASRSYSGAGKLFVWKGRLYKTKTAIASGVTFTDGTNCEPTTLAAVLNM